jgi:hypothetical protein
MNGKPAASPKRPPKTSLDREDLDMLVDDADDIRKELRAASDNGGAA